MARSIRSEDLETRTARLELAVRKKPYTVMIAPGIHLAYRRNKTFGVWSVDAGWLKKFAVADDYEEANGDTVMDYWQAQERAKKLARVGEGDASDKPPTLICDALENYKLDLEARDGLVGNYRHLKFHLEDTTLWKKPVVLLTEKDLKHWRNAIIGKGCSRGTADRCGRILKAILNLAAKEDKRITNMSEWRYSLARIPNADKNRVIELADSSVKAAVEASYKKDFALGVWINLLAETGNREVQHKRLKVVDLDDRKKHAPRLMMPSSKKGKNRQIEYRSVPISKKLAENLRILSAGRKKSDPLLDPMSQLAQQFRPIVTELELGDDVTPYAMRHASIIRMLTKRVPIRIVAQQHDTSTGEIERVYARYLPPDLTEDMIRETLIDFTETREDNVVSMR
jgi:hypothetical protein